MVKTKEDMEKIIDVDLIKKIESFTRINRFMKDSDEGQDASKIMKMKPFQILLQKGIRRMIKQHIMAEMVGEINKYKQNSYQKFANQVVKIADESQEVAQNYQTLEKSKTLKNKISK